MLNITTYFPFILAVGIPLVIFAARQPIRSRKRRILFALAALTPLVFGVGGDTINKVTAYVEARGILHKVFPGQQPRIRIVRTEQGPFGHNFLAEVDFAQTTIPNWKVTEQKLTYNPARFDAEPDDDYKAALKAADLNRFEMDAMRHLRDAGCNEWKQSKVKRFTVQVAAPDYDARWEGKLQHPARLSGDQNYQNYCLFFGFNAL